MIFAERISASTMPAQDFGGPWFNGLVCNNCGYLVEKELLTASELVQVCVAFPCTHCGKFDGRPAVLHYKSKHVLEELA